MNAQHTANTSHTHTQSIKLIRHSRTTQSSWHTVNQYITDTTHNKCEHTTHNKLMQQHQQQINAAFTYSQSLTAHSKSIHRHTAN